MNIKRISSIFVVFAALAIGLFPRPASAQQAVAGEFTLPVKARWGAVVLAPGAYHFSAESPSATGLLRIYDDANPAVSYFIMTSGWDQMAPSSPKSRLILADKDGTAFVKELELGDAGIKLYYGEPKLKQQILARGFSTGKMPAER